MGAGERAADPRAPKPVDRLTVKALRTSALAEQRPRGRLCAERIGHVDEDGFLHLSDRAHDMVISRRRQHISSRDRGLPARARRRARCRGVWHPDEEFGEALAAHLDADRSAALTEASVREHVRARLPGFKVPKVVVFDHDLPREETGKIFKRRIRQRYWEHAGRNI